MKPLEGLVVLDMTRVLAGPFAAMMFADLGAEVIKIERPDGGDDTRAYPPFQKGESAYFMSLNRGKKSVTLNLKHEKGKEILKSLARKSDILIENFKPGTMDKLGLGYEDLRKVNPRLIYAASSGFGQTGPYSSRPAYDLIIQGMGGMMSVTGPDEHTPTKVGSSVADIFAGLFTVIGVLSAVNARNRTGRGQLVDVAMLDCMVAVLENAVSRYLVSGEIPRPIGNRHPSISPFTTLATSDGAMNIAVGNDEIWKRMCAVLGMEEYVNDPRFVDNPARVENFHALKEILEERTMKNTSEHWLAEFEKAHVPSGPINDIAHVVNDP
ncbi:CoA transferase, partial [Aminivibrio sp.]|uniref:CaiB/BaiF CoA transferase family protein n=1 Tax=Aminivibrio sp. TaxID=1872489 RepID=UPI001A6467D0